MHPFPSPMMLNRRAGGGRLFAWGSGSYGRLGLGNTTSYSSPKQVGTDLWIDVASGNYHSVAIRQQGTLWAWGRNNYGQLGDGTTVNKSSPVQIGATGGWLSVFAGGSRSFGVKQNGTLWAWGVNSSGQLGDGTVVNRSSPVQIGTLTDWAGGVGAPQAIGGMVFLKPNGTLWAWGVNSLGNLGLGDITNRSSPTQIGALSTWSGVGAGYFHGFASRSNGTIWAWGRNDKGQLGTGNTTYYSSPVQIGALTLWSPTLSVGGSADHTVAIRAAGGMWNWGRNGNGQLGRGNLTYYSSPVQVGALTNWKNNVTKAVATSRYTTTIIKQDGTLWGIGRGLGGPPIDVSSPVQIGSLSTWQAITMGFGCSVGIAL